MTLHLQCPAKVNLLMNILGKRPDGFHELETLFQPVPVYDALILERTGSGLQVTCSDPSLPTDRRNLVAQAAERFFETSRISPGTRIHIEKHIPQAAGLGGGSSDAAHTLLGLNQLWGQPLSVAQLEKLAAQLGSDVVFFLQPRPAIATGRGEIVQP